MGINYSVDADPDRTAKAMLRERHMSNKHSKEVARATPIRTELRKRCSGSVT